MERVTFIFALSVSILGMYYFAIEKQTFLILFLILKVGFIAYALTIYLLWKKLRYYQHMACNFDSESVPDNDLQAENKKEFMQRIAGILRVLPQPQQMKILEYAGYSAASFAGKKVLIAPACDRYGK